VWLAEAAVPFTQELSAQVARSPSGQTAAYPVVRTVQTGGICSEVVAPAPGLDPERAVDAQRIALEIAGALDVTGMLAVEMFDTGNEILVNEFIGPSRVPSPVNSRTTSVRCWTCRWVHRTCVNQAR
jgi:5-(carboxyamino)imidazole ribonucleotide synthase